MKFKFLAIAVLLSSISLTSCGLQGDLYIDEDPTLTPPATTQQASSEEQENNTTDDEQNSELNKE